MTAQGPVQFTQRDRRRHDVAAAAPQAEAQRLGAGAWDGGPPDKSETARLALAKMRINVGTARPARLQRQHPVADAERDLDRRAVMRGGPAAHTDDALPRQGGGDRVFDHVHDRGHAAAGRNSGFDFFPRGSRAQPQTVRADGEVAPPHGELETESAGKERSVRRRLGSALPRQRVCSGDNDAIGRDQLQFERSAPGRRRLAGDGEIGDRVVSEDGPLDDDRRRRVRQLHPQRCLAQIVEKCRSARRRRPVGTANLRAGHVAQHIVSRQQHLRSGSPVPTEARRQRKVGRLGKSPDPVEQFARRRRRGRQRDRDDESAGGGGIFPALEQRLQIVERAEASGS